MDTIRIRELRVGDTFIDPQSPLPCVVLYHVGRVTVVDTGERESIYFDQDYPVKRS